MENMQNVTEAVKNGTKTITSGKLVGGAAAFFGGGVLTGVAGCKLVQWAKKKLKERKKAEESKVESKEEKPVEEPAKKS